MSLINPNGVILVDKPTGMTSFGVVARIRRHLSDQTGKRAKVGHAGTLDPFASGLLIILTGQACRQAGQFLKLPKSYRATLVLGQTTPTLDVEGAKRSMARQQPSRVQIEAVLQRFCGDIWQKPPAFSALKVNGRRAYDLARRGEAVDLPARKVTISQLRLVEYDYPRLTIDVSVSSGTYIRSLARDIGQTLGVGAYCSALRRTSVGEYDIKVALSLTDLGTIN